MKKIRIAGPPGTGKTKRLVKKYYDHIQQHSATEIIVMSHTNTAADEIRKRVLNKNIRKFGNSSLLEIKIKQLNKLDGLNRVYVSSDCDEILEIAESTGAFPIKRDSHYATNDVSINDVYENLAKSVFPHEHI